MTTTELRTPLFTVEAWVDDIPDARFVSAFKNPFYDRDSADAYAKGFEDQGRAARVVPYYPA